MTAPPNAPRRTRILGATALAALLLVAGLQLAMGRSVRASELTAFAILLALSPWIVRIPGRAVRVLSLVALAALVGLAAYVLVIDLTRWRPVTARDATLSFLAPLGEPILTGRPRFELVRYRAWTISSDDAPRRFTVAWEPVSGGAGYLWQTSANGPEQEALEGGVTRLSFASMGQFAFRSAASDEPLADRVFRATVMLRSAGRVPVCGAVSLGEHGARATARLEMCLDTEWTEAVVDWTAPADSATVLIDVILSAFTSPVDVRDVRLVELLDGAVQPFGALAPTGVTLRLSWDTPFPWSRDSAKERFVTAVPLDRPTTLSLDLPDSVAAGTRAWTTLYVEQGLRVRLLESGWEGAAAHARSSIARLVLWFDHPNQLGHAVAAIGVAAAITASGPAGSLTAGVLAAALILATGSRTALAALALGLVVGFLTRPRRPVGWRRHASIAAFVAVVLVAMLVWWSAPSELPRALAPDGRSVVLRGDIWKHAFALARSHPWLGSDASFASSWSTAFADAPAVTHAHNGFLDALTRYGIAGTVALGLAFASLAVRAGRSRVWRTAVVAATLFVLNLTDATYPSLWVLLPLLLAWQAGDGDGHTTRHATSASIIRR